MSASRTTDCLHCVILRAIRDAAAAAGSLLDGKAICDRAAVIFALTACLADVVLTDPDRGRRVDEVDNVTAVLRGAAAMPRCEQPREDMEVTSWQ